MQKAEAKASAFLYVWESNTVVLRQLVYIVLGEYVIEDHQFIDGSLEGIAQLTRAVLTDV